MIKCPGCGADNLIGAIFCRSCGDKLDIEDMRPDDVAEATAEKTSGKVGKMVRNLVGLVVFLVVAGVSILVLLPAGHGDPGAVSDNELQVAQQRYKALIAGRRGRYTFTIAEINAVADSELGLTAEAKQEAAASGKSEGLLVPEELYIDLLGGDRVRFSLKSRLHQTLPLWCSMSGSMTAGASGIEFNADSVTFGKLPIPIAPLQEQAKGRLMALMSTAPELQKSLVPKVTKIEIDEGAGKVVFSR